MWKRIKDAADYAACPTAWLLAIVAVAATGWIAYETAAGRALVGSVGVLIFLVAAHRASLHRRLAEAEAAAKEIATEKEELLRVFETVRATGWVTDTAGKREFVTPMWESLTGQEARKTQGVPWRDLVHEDDGDRCIGAFRLATSELNLYEVEYRLKGAEDEGGRWVCDRAAPSFNENGTYRGFAGVTMLSSIQDGEKSESEGWVTRTLRLCDSINNMAIHLADRYESLEEDKQRVEYADLVKIEFLAALSEELRAPVEELADATEMLRTPDLDATQKEFVDRIAVAGDFLTRLHGRAVTFSSLDEDPEKGDTVEFDLRRLVEEVTERQAAAATPVRGRSVACIVEDSVPGLVRSDPLRVRRMLMDIWTTTLRFETKGRFLLRVTPDPTPGNDSTIIFTVTVPGSAVSEKLTERAYYPVETMGNEPPGLGLGPCKRLAELMGGKMGIQRDGREMVVFWFSLDMVAVNPNWDGRRSHGRLSQESVRSNLGAVLDLSLGGVRVRCTEPLDGVLDIELTDDEETIVLSGEVCWTRRVGFGKHEAGLRFLDVGAETSAELGRLAARNRLRRVMKAA